MKKLLPVLVAVVLLSGCDADFYTAKFQTVCLDGVEYWTTNYNARQTSLAVKIDPTTLQPLRCVAK
jgi:hypothetical protein